LKVAVIVVGVIAVVVLAVILLRQGHPEQTATADEPTGDSLSDRLYRGVDRPAGPDVEDQSIGDPRAGETSQPGVAPDRPPEPPAR